MKGKIQLKYLLFSLLILGGSFTILIFFQEILDIRYLASVIFILAIFLISLLTEGYLWGVAAALVSMFAVNFAFTFPYFRLNFAIPENLVSAVVMLCVAIMTSTLTTNLKKQGLLRAENEKEKVRANLLRAVSHDLRTPLTSIYGSCSTIIENYDILSKEQKLKLLADVCSDAEWLNRMVENLLSVTRIDSGSVSVIKTPTVLEELIDSALVKFRKHYPDQPVSVTIPETFIVIPMDSILIEQVIINLLENAAIHAGEITKLELKVYMLGKQAIFEVADNGSGIPKDKLNGIISGNFEKLPPCSDSGSRGIGIGLSVCTTIIRAHGGEISIVSNVGAGTTVRFSLETEESEDEQQIQNIDC